MFGTFGTVAKLIIQGNTTSPETAKISQLFSHRHPVIRFIGAAKLPLRMPASTTTASPERTFPLMGSYRWNNGNGINLFGTASGENEPSQLLRSRKITAGTRGVQSAHSQKAVARASPGHSFVNDRGIFLVHSSAKARSTFVDTQRRIEYSHDISKRAHRTP